MLLSPLTGEKTEVRKGELTRAVTPLVSEQQDLNPGESAGGVTLLSSVPKASPWPWGSVSATSRGAPQQIPRGLATWLQTVTLWGK